MINLSIETNLHSNCEQGKSDGRWETRSFTCRHIGMSACNHELLVCKRPSPWCPYFICFLLKMISFWLLVIEGSQEIGYSSGKLVPHSRHPFISLSNDDKSPMNQADKFERPGTNLWSAIKPTKKVKKKKKKRKEKKHSTYKCYDSQFKKLHHHCGKKSYSEMVNRVKSWS